MSNQVLIIAGEKSGEEHALSFLPKLKETLPDIHFFGVGGEALKKEGVELLYHLEEFSSWGVSEVITKIPFYLNALKHIENEVTQRNCKVAILIDFQSFNMKLAKKLKKNGVKVLYYVAPQAWAWKEWRTKVLEETVDTLFTIIPFEKKWFEDKGVSKVVSISHPLWNHYHEQLKQISPTELSLEAKPFSKFEKEVNILILPGSRNSEVKCLLQPFIKAAEILKKRFPVNLGIVKSPNVNPYYYKPYDRLFKHEWESEQLDQALRWADFSIATSGTVTLTCALFEVPTVVSFDSSLFNGWIFYTFVNYDWYASLANIVHEEEVFPELIGEECSDYTIVNLMSEWLTNPEKYNKTKEKLSKTLNLIDESEVDVSQIMKDVISKASTQREGLNHG